jgi:hypothetical protein
VGTGISNGVFLLLPFCGRTVGDAGPYKNMRKIKIKCKKGWTIAFLSATMYRLKNINIPAAESGLI